MTTIAKGIEIIEAATNNMSMEELRISRNNGYLPDGIYTYLMVLRKAFPNRYVDNPHKLV